MNKLFSKIASLSIGLALAIGVGVAIGGKEVRVASATSSTVNFIKSGYTYDNAVVTLSGNASSKSGSSYWGMYGGASLTTSSTYSIDSTQSITIGMNARTYGSMNEAQKTMTFNVLNAAGTQTLASGTLAPSNNKINSYSTTISAINSGTNLSVKFQLISNGDTTNTVFVGMTAAYFTYTDAGGDVPSEETIDSFNVAAPSAYTRTDPISLSDWTITPVLSEGGTPTSIANKLSVSPALSTETAGNFNATITYDASTGPYKMSDGVSNQIPISYVVNPIPDTELEFKSSSYKIGIGADNSLDLENEIKAETGDSPISYSILSSNPSGCVSLSNGVATGVSIGNAVIRATKGSLSPVDLTIQVRNMALFTDTLTRDTTGVAEGASTYSDWSGKQASDSSHSEAVYAGNSAGSNDSIQLRSNNSNSGIVSTGTGGSIKSVTINFNSNTVSDRTVQIYGKDTSYSSASDLYGDAKGTLIDEVVCSAGASQTINISNSYQYVGLRSRSGAIYLDSVVLVWEQEKIEKTIEELTVSSRPTKDNYAAGESLSLTGIVVTASFVEEGIDDLDLPSSDYTVSPVEGYRFTASDAEEGSKEIHITYSGDLKTLDDEPVSVSFFVSVSAAKPNSITQTTAPSWTDVQALSEGAGRWTVTYTDDSTVTNIKIGDENTVLKIDGVAVDVNQPAINYKGKQATLEYTDQNVTLTNGPFDVNPTILLSVDSFEKDFDYLLTGGEESIVTAKFTSINGEPDSYSVVSSNASKLSVEFDESLVEYDSTKKTGSLMFGVTPGNTQGAYIVTVSVTKGERTESKSLSITVRGEAPTPAGVQYEKITSIDDVVTGKYVVTANVNGTYYALPSIGGSSIDAETVAVTDDVITEEDAGLLPVDITKKSSTEYAISKSGTYITFPTSGTNLGSSSNATYYTMTVSNGIFKINSSGRGLVYRTGSYNYWKGYANSNVNGTEYFGLTLFKQVSSGSSKEGFDYVQEFVDGYMYMDTISITDKGSGACKGENGYYLTAKRAWNTMITTYNSEVPKEDREDLKNIFETSFVDAYARYMAWASACGDAAPFVGTTINGSGRFALLLSSKSSATTIIIVAISAISAASIGGYFLFRKKKED